MNSTFLSLLRVSTPNAVQVDAFVSISGKYFSTDNCYISRESPQPVFFLRQQLLSVKLHKKPELFNSVHTNCKQRKYTTQQKSGIPEIAGTGQKNPCGFIGYFKRQVPFL